MMNLFFQGIFVGGLNELFFHEFAGNGVTERVDAVNDTLQRHAPRMFL
jgi:hypothetical protein